MPARIKALIFLGWSLVVTLLSRLFGSKKSLGIAQFEQNYAQDRLPPVTPEEREAISGFGGCIACSICDRGEINRIAASRGEYLGVMHLMLGASRSMPDFGAAALSFGHVSDEVLAAKERECPTAVPMRAIAKFVREKAQEEARLDELARAAGGQRPAPRPAA